MTDEQVHISDAKRKLNKILEDQDIKCPTCKSGVDDIGIVKFGGEMVAQQLFSENQEYYHPEDRIFVRYICKCKTVFDRHYVSQYYIDNLQIFLARFPQELLTVFLRGFMFCNKIASLIDLLRLNGVFNSELHLEENHYIPHRRNNFYLLCHIISEIYEFVAGDSAPLGIICGMINNDSTLASVKNEECFTTLQGWQRFNNWKKDGKWDKNGKDYYAFIRNVITFHNAADKHGKNNISDMLDRLSNDSKELVIGVHSGTSNNNFDRTFTGYLLDSWKDILPEFNELVKSSRAAIDAIPRNFEELFIKVCDVKSGASKLLAHREYIDYCVVKV